MSIAYGAGGSARGGGRNHRILAIYDVGTHHGAPYIVSELLQGDTLRGRLVSSGASGLPVRKAVDYAVQIARGLAAAHDKGIIHRDLKPENVFVTSDGHVKILDFGLAKLTEDQAVLAGVSQLATDAVGTQPGMLLGTMGYMAPEQVRGQAADHRSDIFAFGAILYEMLSGQRAFRGPTTADTITAILERIHGPSGGWSVTCHPRSCASSIAAWKILQRGSSRRTIWPSRSGAHVVSPEAATSLVRPAPKAKSRERVAWTTVGVPAIVATAASTVLVLAAALS